ncbi:MAG: hypothetical protein ACI9Z9_002694, partial [Litorivivens sp.]
HLHQTCSPTSLVCVLAVRQFLYLDAILPLALQFTMLLFVGINLAISRSEE